MSRPGFLPTLCLAVLFLSAPARAQELSPRAFWPAPVGTQVLTVGASHTSGDLVSDPSLPIAVVDSSIDSVNLSYLRTLDVWGRTANIKLDLPYANGETRALGFDDRIKGEYRGVGDVAATFSLNLMGAPALSREDFAALRANPRPIVGMSLKVLAPTGDYDSDRLLNVGANRWAAKAELGYIQALRPQWLLEVQAGLWVFADNDDFLGLRREQSPIGSLEAHLVHRFGPGFWGSIDATVYRGGRSRIGGEKLGELQRDSKLGMTLAFPLSRGHVLRFGYSYGSINDDDETFEVVSVAYSRVF